MRHILDSKQFDKKLLEELFKTATNFEGVRDDSLKGKILATIFYEPSTRTRLSFESAMHRLGGSVISVADCKSSSHSKGETLEDSTKVISNYADVIVMRHSEVGALKRAAEVSNVPIINAGDGNTGHHPTQALLDLYTMQRELGRLDNLHIAFIGNIRYYRSPRSLVQLLSLYEGIKISFVSSPELGMDEEIKKELQGNGVVVEETEDMESILKNVDVLYQTRIAKEWIPSEEEYEKQKGHYTLSRTQVDAMKDGAIVMHPLPRVDEISTDVDSSPKAVYFKQSQYGVLVRMALLKYVLS